VVTSEVGAVPAVPSTKRPRRLAVMASLAIALVYAAIYLGVVSIGAAESGELGVLGVAGLVFLAIALVLWRTSSRAVWIGIIVMQVLTAVMYVQIAPDREPAFEIWGLTIRGLSVVLVVALVWLLAASFRSRKPNGVDGAASSGSDSGGAV
jgi:hypothetical protein